MCHVTDFQKDGFSTTGVVCDRSRDNIIYCSNPVAFPPQGSRFFLACFGRRPLTSIRKFNWPESALLQ